VAHVPGITGAHTQAETLDEINRNMKEVFELLIDSDAKKSSG
jgi:predicted RNase H-like HicB family nuclease